jgi:hypothetical protein
VTAPICTTGARVPEVSPHTALGRLAARAAIREELTEYFAAVTRHDWDRVRRSFRSDATLDYGTPGVVSVDDNLALLRAGTERLTATSTLLGMQSVITVHGETAHSETTTFTAHTPGDGTDRARMSIVVYVDDWASEPTSGGTWLVTKRVVHHRIKGWLDLGPAHERS